MVKAREKTDAPLAARLFGSKRLTRQSFPEPVLIASPSDTLDPLLLSPRTRVAVLSPDEGRTAQFYALKKPEWQIFAWLPGTAAMVRVQSRLMELPNLFFDRMPEEESVFEIDALIAVGAAHQVFSREGYALSALTVWMKRLLSYLPENGQLLIQDVALPEDAERFILLDIADTEAASALEVFAEKARPQAPAPLQGFFMEKLTSPQEGVARYRLPQRAAAEFFQRWRFGIAPEAPFELTTLSVEQWAALAEGAGGRAVYRAPHALNDIALNDAMIFRDEDGKALPFPPGSFTLLIEKVAANKPLALYERRPSHGAPQTLALSGMKDSKTQAKKPWVEIADKTDDVLVWRFDEQQRVRVWVRSGVARPLVNTVPRGTPNLDGRRWAGYLVEPMAYPATEGRPPFDLITDMLHEELGLPIAAVKEVRAGLRYYPEPESVNQRVRGIFVRVNQELPPCDEIADGINQGRMIEVLADDVLRAIGAGLIPDGKLEILIGKLLHDLGLKSEESGAFLNRADLEPFLKKTKEAPHAEKAEMRDGSALERHVQEDERKLRAMRSVFIADHVTPSGRAALGVSEHDFIMPDGLSANTAVVVPLMRNAEGQFLFGAQPRQFAVPSRLGDTSPMTGLLNFRLPGDVRTLDAVREFLAAKLDVALEDFASLGPSFFVQPALSPERAYPFLLRATEKIHDLVQWYRMKSQLPRLLEPPVEKTAAYLEFSAARNLGEWYAGFSPAMVQELARQQSAKAQYSPATIPVKKSFPSPGVK